MTRLLNFAAFQAGWFACILFAAQGRPWLGPLVVAGLVGIHVTLLRRPANDLLLLLGAGGFGYLADSALVRAGVLAFPAHAVFGEPSTLWMAALWVNFAMTIPLALSWLRGRPWLAAALGAVGGPAAYVGGMRLGAVSSAESMPVFAAIVGCEWALATPALLSLAEATGSFPARRYDSGEPAESGAAA